jgi:tRNA threonylcarbamoyladenosine biosynthesis protein TsaB
MTLILCIETATPVCSVALVKGMDVVALKETKENNAHSALLTMLIRDILKENGMRPHDLVAVAVSMGPGSYTGLRIGVSAAKGLCYGADIPLIAINTLRSMALGISAEMKERDKNTLFCPMIDARRMEVYAALFDSSGSQIRETRAEIVTAESFGNFLGNHTVVFCGDGASKCKEIITHPNAIFKVDFMPSAAHMRTIAAQRFSEGIFENVAYFEPFYLKDFIAGIPKVKGLS